MPVLALGSPGRLVSSGPGTGFREPSQNSPHAAGGGKLHEKGEEETSEPAVLEHEPGMFRALCLV